MPKMVVLVSANTKESRWIPWELGLGDEAIKISNVALFPVVVDTTGIFRTLS